jgi:hypothetical protein
MPRKRSKFREIKRGQGRFVEAVEAIGDLLVYETKRRKNDKVVRALHRMRPLLNKFAVLKREHPYTFEEFLRSHPPHKARRRPARAPGSGGAESSFSAAVSQLMRIHECALRSRNDEITIRITGELVSLLTELTKGPGNERFVEDLLRSLWDISQAASEAGDISMFPATGSWYLDIVFRDPMIGGRDFDLSYLTRFNHYLSASLRRIVYKNQWDVFKAVLTSFHHGGLTGIHPCTAIWDYSHIVADQDLEEYKRADQGQHVRNATQGLYESHTRIYTRRQLDAWFDEFDQLKSAVLAHLDEQNRIRAKENEDEVRKAVTTWFKYNSLLEIVLELGAYCVFKRAADYIGELWEFKQPRDAGATWVCLDIVPRSVQEVLSLCFRPGQELRRLDTWEDHHGVELYYTQYLLLLLMRCLGPKTEPSEGQAVEEKFCLQRNMEPRFYSDLLHEVDTLVSLARKLKQDKQFKDLLGKVGFRAEALDEDFDNRLIVLLDLLKSQAEDHLKSYEKEQAPSETKIEEFKREVLSAFTASATATSVFGYCGLYQDCSDQPPADTDLLCVGPEVVPKGGFFGNWHVDYSRFGERYGTALARGEDHQVVETISKFCEPRKRVSLCETLGELGVEAEPIVLSSQRVMHDLFRSDVNMRWHWYADQTTVDVLGYQGTYLFEGRGVPVFEFAWPGTEKQMLVLDVKRLGLLLQESPLRQGDDPALRTGLLRIDVRAFSQDEELLESELKKQFDWLQEQGDEDAQRDYLLGKVWIHVCARFRFEKHSDFQGYLVEL